MKTEDLLAEALSLPAEQRAMLVDALLNSFYPTDPEIDKAWAAEAERRLVQIESGEAKLIPGEEVFAKLREKYGW